MSSIDVLMGLRDLVKANKDHYLATAKEQDISRCGSSGDITRDLANDCEREIEALAKAIEALEKVGHVEAIRKELDSMSAIFVRRFDGMFVDRDYLKRFIDSLDK